MKNHRITEEYSELEGSHWDHQCPDSGPAQDHPKSPVPLHALEHCPNPS